jgi:DNA replicative helicase MCM subunit Mcm2 (Cdc46/Mcm family)
MMAREKILVYGDTGTGKTYNAFKIASHLPNARFYWLDTDDAFERGLEEFPELEGRITSYPCQTWEQVEAAVADIEQKVKAQDWIIIDMVDALWGQVQSYFVSQVFGKKKDDYFLEVRKAMRSGASIAQAAFKGWIDWPVINAIYQDLINRVCFQMPANIYLAAKSASMTGEEEAGFRDLFSGFLFKPEGEKRNPYRIHTILFLHKERTKEGTKYYCTTVKDRGGRPYLNGVALHDFYLQYLAALAKWPVERGE